MLKSISAKNVLVAALAAVLIAGVFALSGCACSSNQPQSSTSSTSASSGDVMYTVPNVVSLTQADARKAILASGLQVGTITNEPSDTVPLGSVISQDPAALTNAKANSKVNLVISSGKKEAQDVKVPDLKGMWQEDARKALSDAGLVGIAATPEESDEVQPGQVFKQSISAGATVKEGTKVSYTVALSPTETTVPGVIGMTRDDAKAAITNAKLSFDSTTAYSDSVEEGKVMGQSIAANTQVKQGTEVSVTVSLGPKPAQDVTVPDVTSYSWADAQATLQSAGLAARYTGDPAGVVVAQDVAPGTKVAPYTLVTVTLSTPAQMVEVPNLVGMSVSAAEAATDAVGLGLDASASSGTVIDQSPAAGQLVETRTVVSVTVQTDDDKTAKAFMGKWQSDRANIEINNIGSGFTVTVSWASDSEQTTTWEYNCEIKDGKMVSDNKGRKSEVITDSKGQSTNVLYEDGSATFSIDNQGKLTWKDDKEDAGKNMKFDKMTS